MQKNTGFLALLSILLGTAIVLVLFAKFYFAPQKQSAEEQAVQPKGANDAIPTTELSRMRADINAAERTRQMLNEQNKATNAAMGE